MSKLDNIDKSIKLDSFDEIFTYILSKVGTFSKSSKRYIDELFDQFIKTSNLKDQDFMTLMNELNKVHELYYGKYPLNSHQFFIVNYLISKSYYFISEVGFSELKNDEL